MVRGWCGPRERASGDGLGRIPDEVVVVGSRSRRVEVSDLQVAVVDEPLGVLRNATAHAVVGHREKCLSVGVGSV